MKLHRYIYATLIISFSFLVFAFVLVYNNINESSNVIKYIQKGQIRLNYYANKTNYDIKKNQANILQLIILNPNSTIKEEASNIESASIQELDANIKNLQHFLGKHKDISQNTSLIIEKLINKSLMYKDIQKKLIETLKSHKQRNMHVSLISFNTITIDISKDIERLQDIANEQLYMQILSLKKKNENNATIMFFALFIFIILIFFTTYRFIVLHTKVKKELQRAESAEQSQKKLQEQLLKYNEDLENEILRKTEEIREKVYTNFLTGLPNRNKLLEDIATKEFSFMALLNIDKFQAFNDVYGEELGNIALQMSATFLKKLFEKSDVSLYHVGGDEFALSIPMFEHYTKEGFIDLIYKTLKQYKEEKFVYEDKSFNFVMSCGIASNGKKKMLAYADMALKDAKKRNLQLSTFEDDKELELTHQNDLECHAKLIYALENKGIVSYFQPITPIQDQTLPMKYESLVRLREENGNIQSPFLFIDVAKKNRIYNKITAAVIQNTLDVVSKHQINCSLNLSLDDINNEETMKELFTLLDAYEHNELLTIELLETEEFTDYQVVYDFCIKVHSYGLKVALDDFGSGYANFSHILKLPVDYIKIDATLISNIDRDHNSQIMVETIVDLAKKLNVYTIAEFVSSKEILDTVKELGVDYVQGFHLGKPEPIEYYFKK